MINANSASRAITVGVFAALAYDVTSANLSSPQTFELNSKQRAPTLMKWLRMNCVEALAWGGFGSVLEGNLWPLVGTSMGIASMYLKYKYAIVAGQRSGLPDMENHATGGYNL